VKKLATLLILSLLVGFTLPAFAGGGTDGKKFNVAEMINHHILDAHEWHLFSTTDEAGKEHHYSIPLPIILWTNEGLVVFSSSEFHHNSVVSKGNNHYILDHEHIYLADEQGKKLEGVAQPLDFSITKNVASMLISVVILLLVFFNVKSAYVRRAGKAPKGLQSLLEPLILFIRDEIAIPNIGHHYYKKYLPYLLTLFFFIWVNNLLGLVPTGANLTGNIAFTMVMASLTLLLTVFSGNKSYWGHIFATPGVPKPLLIVMIPVEVIGIFTKPFALMIRLFANITAGHTIILSLIGLVFIFRNVFLGVPVTLFVLAMNCLELFVALLQAYIFTLLTALFIGQAVAEDHH
jgi:F-type H+-transporting ATPase subunit a